MSLNRITLFVAILGMICFSSCDGDDPNSGGIDTKDSKELVLKVIVPGINNSVTRGINATDENELGKIDVLVFKVNGANEEFLYHTSATDEHISNSSKTFKVLLQKSIGSVRHRIVVLANLRAEINAVKDSFTVGDLKADVLKLIEFSSTTAWKATSSSNFRLLPMWGESYATHEITSTTTGITLGNIYLVRSLAKIDVLLADNGAGVPQGLSGFKLSNVKLFKSREKGHAVPESVVRTVDAGTGKVNIKVTSPTIPSTGNGYNVRLDYDTPTVAGAFLGEIYVLENNNKSEGDDAKRTCVVVGGYYTPDLAPENTTKVTWYRIDFYDRAGSPGDRLDILRNHRYRVNITSVGGPGYETPEIAFESTPVNLDSEVIAWDEGGMNNHTSDGQYDLTTDKNEITLYEEGNIHLQQLTVFTNHPGGWTVEIPSVAPEDYSWISVSPDKLISSTSTETNVSATPYLNQLTERKGYFWLKAGKMKKKIHVTQLNVPELMLEITPSELVFRKSGSNPKSVTVTSYPTGAVRFMSSSGDVVWASGSDPATDLSGLRVTSYTFQPAPNLSNPLKTLNSFVTIWINHPNGTQIARILTVRQLATDLLFSVTLGNYYSTAATYSVTVDSDTPWRISSVTDPSSALAGAFDNTIKGIGTGTVYSFPLTANNSWEKRSLTFTPSSDDPDFSGQPFIIKQNNPNPSLTLDKATINFGSAGNPGNNSVVVTSNAKWQYSVSGNWTDAVASSTPAAGVVQGAHNYHTTSNIAVTIIPKVWTAAVGTPTAGTVHTGTATFSTADHSPATAATKSMTVSRTVPTFYIYSSISPATVARASATTTVSANTNAAWKVTASAGGVITSAQLAQSAYGLKTVKVAITDNTTWSGTTAAVKRSVGITTHYGFTTSSMPTAGPATNVMQPGYYISALTRTLSALAANGGTNASVTITGAYPAIATRAVVNGTSTVVSNTTPSVTASEGVANAANFTINANPSWSARDVICQYQNPRNANAWTSIGTAVSQPGYKITNATVTPVTASAGGTSSIRITGYRPGISVQIRNTQSGTVSGVLAGSITGDVGKIDITVPTNTGAKTRALTAYYHGKDDWIEIATWNQAGTPNYFVLASGTKVSNFVISGPASELLSRSGASSPRCDELMDETGYLTAAWDAVDKQTLIDKWGANQFTNLYINAIYPDKPWSYQWFQYNTTVMGNYSANEIVGAHLGVRCIKVP